MLRDADLLVAEVHDGSVALAAGRQVLALHLAVEMPFAEEVFGPVDEDDGIVGVALLVVGDLFVGPIELGPRVRHVQHFEAEAVVEAVEVEA